jgi:uncharacterized RDD family membrane protein YckC
MSEQRAPVPLPPAGADRRFYAFVLDRLLVWGLLGGAAWAAYVLLIEPGRVAAGIALIAGSVVLLTVLTATALGRWGVTPGKAALGLRAFSVAHGGPIGFWRALLRTVVLGLATLPTLGIGVAALAWTAVADPGGRRRGWHDRIARSEVVGVRRPPVVDEPGAEAPRPVVNLTAMRLVPPSPMPPPPRIPERVQPPEPVPVGAPTTTVTPRQQLGWPLVGEPPVGPPPGRRPPPPPPPPPPGQREATRGQTATRWRVTFDTGESFEVQGLTLVGRRPEARPGEPVRQVVPLPSEDMSLSKTHAQFQVVPDGALVVMDRGSTNGSILFRAGMTRRLPGGRPATLHDGDRVRFGDREMTVVRLA